MTSIDATFLVIGGGSIGRRHLQNLRHLGVTRLAVFDPSPERRAKAEADFGASPAADLEAALDKAEAAIICSPTHLHAQHCVMAAQAGSHIFVEKPVACDLELLDQIAEDTGRQGLKVFVACNFRFHPGLRKAKDLIQSGALGRVWTARAQFGQYLPDWHPWEDYRQTYSANRAMGGGVILDRIHEIDYLCWLFGDVAGVFAVSDRLSDLQIDCEDVVEAILWFRSGALVSLHLDYLRRTRDCSLDISASGGVVAWNFHQNRLSWRLADDGVWQSNEWDSDVNAMYVAEMAHFLQVVDGAVEPAQDLAQGRRALEVALALKRSAAERAVIAL